MKVAIVRTTPKLRVRARTNGARGSGTLVAALLVAACTLWIPLRANAACHVAAFTDTTHEVGESAGKVELTVELVGGDQSCSGSVHYKTADGSARAPGDYGAREGELQFTAGDDRRESFTIPIVNDTIDEARESFSVRLTAGATPGNIQPSSTPAIVSISDNDDAPAKAASQPATSASPTGTSSAVQAAPIGDEGGSGAGPVLGIVAAVVVLGGAGFLIWRRRGRATPS